jgi:hypothetical protein
MLLPGRVCVVCALLWFPVIPLLAQPSLDRETVSPLAWSQLVRPAGFIFSGTVLSVAPDPPQPGQAASVRTTFQVDHGFRGVRNGAVLSIREWAGLWESGARYRPGQHVFLFLYPLSKLGLTSPVGGDAGRFLTDNQGDLLLNTAMPPGKNPRSPAITRPVALPRRELIRQIRQALEAGHATR